MWHLGTWVSGGLGSAEGTAGVDLRGLFHPKRFYVSMTFQSGVWLTLTQVSANLHNNLIPGYLLCLGTKKETHSQSYPQNPEQHLL